MAFRLLHRRKQKSITVPISGNELAFYAILNQTRNGVIKVEGRHMRWGKLVNFYDVVAITDGQLAYHISHTPEDLEDYRATKESLNLQLDNVDVATVIRYYKNTRKA